MWVVLTVFAAFLQSWRNALKSKLSRSVGVLGTTLARFIFSSPIAGCYLMLVYAIRPDAPIFPHFTAWPIIVIAALFQILATVLMVRLFQLNNYTVGAGLAKSEAIAAAILGVMFFGTSITLLGWVGIVVGTFAVFMLSSGSITGAPSIKTLVLGLGSGTAFALASLCVRESTIESGLPFPHNAAWVLFSVITLQALLLLTCLILFDRQTLVAMWSRKRLTFLISVTSCLGSIGWFSAMALQEVPYVKTLGQIEVFFTILISRFWLKDQFKKYDTLGLMLIALSAVLVMWI